MAIRRKLLSISPDEASFGRRGFGAANEQRRARLERIGGVFIAGYNARLGDTLDAALLAVEPELRGFAVEGAAMAAALLDHLTPWNRRRFARLLEEYPEHRYMIHVGAGWAAARLRLSLRRVVARLDRVLAWLVADGWGFHQAYFAPRTWTTGRRAFPARGGYLARAVDQGIGRALWFVTGADPAGVAARVEAFAAERRPDLWSGVGLAATYAGGASRGDLLRLVALAGRHRPHLAQGAAFAATTRVVAGNLSAHVEDAARAIAGRSTAELTRLSLAHEPSSAGPLSGEVYEGWRARIRQELTAGEIA